MVILILNKTFKFAVKLVQERFILGWSILKNKPPTKFDFQWIKKNLWKFFLQFFYIVLQCIQKENDDD